VARAPLRQAQGRCSSAKCERTPRHGLGGLNSSGHHGDSDPYSRVPRIKQEIPAPNEIDIAVVGVGPSSRPGLPDFESVPAVGEAGMTCHHGHVADSKVVLASKVGAKMVIRNSPQLGVSLFMSDMLLMSDMLFVGHVPLFSALHLMRLVLLFLVCFVPFFFVHRFSFRIPVLVLSSSGDGTCQHE
jgi:hypothetical protein